MSLRARTIACLVAAFALASVAPARAQQAVNSLQEAIDRVQRENGGKILSAETVNMGRGKVYRVKVLTPGGQVRTLQVTAATPPAASKARPAPRAPEPRAEPAIETPATDGPGPSND